MLYAGSEASVGSWTPVYLDARRARRGAGRGDHVGVLGGVVRRPHCRGGRGPASSADRLLTVSYAAAAGRRVPARGTRHRLADRDRPDCARLRLRSDLSDHDGGRHRGVSARRRRGGERIGVLASIGGMILPASTDCLIARIGTWHERGGHRGDRDDHVPRMDGDQAPLRRARLIARNPRTQQACRNDSRTTAPRRWRLRSGCGWRAGAAGRARPEAARTAEAAVRTRREPGRLGWPGCPAAAATLR